MKVCSKKGVLNANNIAVHNIVVCHYEALTSIWKKRVHTPVSDILSCIQDKDDKRDYYDRYEEVVSKFPSLSWPPKDQVRKGTWMPHVQFKPNRESEDIAGQILGYHWKRVIIDEAHNMKNEKTHLALMSNALCAKYRWPFTGTPIINCTEDIWSLLRFARVEGLVTKGEFKKYRLKAEEVEEKMAKEEHFYSSLNIKPKKRKTEESDYLSETLQENVFRVRKEDIARATNSKTELEFAMAKYRGESMIMPPSKDIPGVYAEEISITLSGVIKEYYIMESVRRKDEYYSNFIFIEDENHKEINSEMRGHILSTISILREICSYHPLACMRSSDDYLRAIGGKARITSVNPPKFEAISDYLKRKLAPNESCIIFFEYVDACYGCASFLIEAGYGCMAVTGDDDAEARIEKCKTFMTNPEYRILVATDCIHQGVTLTKANRVIIATPWWHSAKERQKWGRTHRLGQKKDVHVVYITVNGGIDERIREIAKMKELNEDAISLELLKKAIGYI
jgi:SNF2 family DNA or RNA helicase